MKYSNYKKTVDYKRFDAYQSNIKKCDCGHSVFYLFMNLLKYVRFVKN